MIKMPKLSDLTDMEKLKELGNSIVDNAKSQVDKVKTTMSENAQVGQLMDKVKSTIGSTKADTADGKEQLHLEVAAIEQSLQALFEAQKQQLALMNALKKQVHRLVGLAHVDNQPPAATPTDEDTPI